MPQARTQRLRSHHRHRPRWRRRARIASRRSHPGRNAVPLRGPVMPDTAMTDVKPLSRTEMAARVARDIPEGCYVNLGIGIPTAIADHVPLDREVIFHSENGVLGMGPAPPKDQIDPWLINAGKQYVTLRQDRKSVV